MVSRAQLFAIGLGKRAIENRIGRGLLHPLHRGVYAVGHRPGTRYAAWMAAVLAGGAGAVLSHRSAAAMWGMRDSWRADIEVTTPRLCRRPGIHAHRYVLPADEVTIERGIPVTTSARTLFDLAAVLREDQLEHAFDEAEYARNAQGVRGGPRQGSSARGRRLARRADHVAPAHERRRQDRRAAESPAGRLGPAAVRRARRRR
ncbi:MAG: hypothetical protein ACJ74C_00050, partial [Gaiellaceae bacterium]